MNTVTRRGIIGAAIATSAVAATATSASASGTSGPPKMTGETAPTDFKSILDMYRQNTTRVTLRTINREYVGWIQWVQKGYIMFWNENGEMPVRISSIESVLPVPTT